ncbi:hypothetical protein FJQ98_16535 [Lysinibacillus agricola]|uniref:DUF5082 domain-containing protein n=1 Tax=Lysinibacillus agricola TaxID=2590012 RepID=A0ABX7ALR4_9BACI|nr:MULTISPECIES: hypothetical protein [Lysinibacillus]KOS61464.1 hypothetical protein AN161_17895 [Lysinibacillus sp. FJAT-14222]QQP10853.1 hypothetical protein FJQ98_16535 [Lysinibacillus agricola]
MKLQNKISVLSTMKAKELQEAANKEGLAWYNREEKRKMHKGEIITMLTDHYTELAKLEVKVENTQNNELEIENSTTVQLVSYFKELASSVVSAAKEDYQQATQQLTSVKQLLSDAMVKLNDKLTDKRNKLLARNWALTINNIKCILSTAERKISAAV